MPPLLKIRIGRAHYRSGSGCCPSASGCCPSASGCCPAPRAAATPLRAAAIPLRDAAASLRAAAPTPRTTATPLRDAAPAPRDAAPDALVNVPDALVSAPGALVSAPDALVNVPGALVSAPDALVNVPGALVSAPGALVNVPGALVIDQPSGKLDQAFCKPAASFPEGQSGTHPRNHVLCQAPPGDQRAGSADAGRHPKRRRQPAAYAQPAVSTARQPAAQNKPPHPGATARSPICYNSATRTQQRANPILFKYVLCGFDERRKTNRLQHTSSFVLRPSSLVIKTLFERYWG
jgi:hypothetical protein